MSPTFARTCVVLLALALPSAAHALSLSPRLAYSLVIEDGPPGTDDTATGSRLSLGVGVGVPLLSVVADLGFRKAAVSSPSDGWTEYGTDDTTFTVGLRSKLTVLPLFDVAAELHAGRSWADHTAKAVEEVVVTASDDAYFLYGGAAEVSYRLTKQLSLGVRVGADRFEPFGTEERKSSRFETDFARTSYTAGILLGLGL